MNRLGRVAEIKLQMARIDALHVLARDDWWLPAAGDPPEHIYRQWIHILEEHLPCRVRITSVATRRLPLAPGVFRASLRDDPVLGLRVHLSGSRHGATAYPSDFCRNVADGRIVDVGKDDR